MDAMPRRAWKRSAHFRFSLSPDAAIPLREARARIGIAALAADGLRRGALARLRRSRLVRWRHRAPVVQELVLAPPDLRPVDPSFADEVASGGMGLAGLTAALGGASPFAVLPPSAAWARELHGFGWLRHFAAARTQDNETLARRLVGEWLATRRQHRRLPEAWAPEVVGRRMISWLSHQALLLEGVGRRPLAAFLRSLEEQAGYLSAAWRDTPDGYPRLLALIGWVQACLCIGGHERRLAIAERHLVAELGRQVLDDGGHASRNPRTLVALLLDLMPLRQCFIARDIAPSPALSGAIDRMMPMLRRLRLGDGQLARFNGVGAAERDALAMVLGYDRGGYDDPPPVSRSGYARMERGTTAIVIDAGAAPPLALSADACAGCLSFEVSTGPELLLVNGGAPVVAHERATAAARGTASHNTLVLGGQSSSKLVRNAAIQRRIGAAPILLPERVTCDLNETEDGVMVRAAHDGYITRFGLLHARTLVLSADGTCLDGEDTLEGARGEVRLPRDVPVSVHFHLPPHAGARYGAEAGSADLLLRNGEHWRLSAAGATLTIEPGTYFAEVIGPVRAQQVVLRTVCYGATHVRWRLEVSDPPPRRRPGLTPTAAPLRKDGASDDSQPRARRRWSAASAPPPPR
jgi:uncharacterized heparinase superfamily protein